MVYNWPEGTDRYERVARFVDGLFSKIDQLRQPPRHPKWRETSLSAKILGLQRFKAADDWLAAHAIQSAAGTTLSPPDREKLFNDFMQWQRTTR
jgi:hypothetical protein